MQLPPILSTAALLAGTALAQTPANHGPSTLWWADVDGDGLEDAFVTRPGGGRLLWNAGAGTFRDVSERVGLAGANDAFAALWADVSGDGRLDLFLPSFAGASQLWLQTPGGTFVETTEASGLPRHAEPVHAEWRDFDGDRLFDLHLVTPYDELLYRNLGRAQFARVDLGLEPRVPAGPLPASLEEARRLAGLAPSGPTPPTTSQALIACPASIMDLGNPAVCINASTTPVLGALYPLSSDLMVDGAGNVGVGTTTPGEQLDVAGTARAARFVSTVGAGTAPFVVASPTLVSGLNADLLDGLDAGAFRASGVPIGLADLAPDSVDSSKVVDGSLGAADLGADSVGSSEIQSDAVGAAEIAMSAVGSSEVLDGSIGSADLGPNAVSSGHVVDGSLTAADLAANSVGSAQIQNGAVGANEIGGSAVGSAEIANGQVALVDLAANAVDSSKVVDGSLTAADLGLNSVGAAAIASAAVGNSELAGSAVTSAKIANGTIVNADVSASAAIAGTKVLPDFGFQDVMTTGKGHFEEGSGVAGNAALDALGPLDADGFAGVQGATDFNGVGSADWSGLEIGVAGLSTGSSTTDNYGVLGHSNGVAIRGEHSTNPTVDFAELGASGVGLRAGGSTLAADLDGRVAIVTSIPSGSSARMLTVDNNLNLTGVNSGQHVNFETASMAAGGDILQIDQGSFLNSSIQFIEAQSGAGDVRFRVDGDGDVFSDGAYTGPADFAEMLAVSTGATTVEAGDVVVIDPEALRSVRRSKSARSRLVAGVYSTTPGFVGSERQWEAELGPDGEPRALKRGDMAEMYDEVPVAVVGIVPCKVVDEGGPIRPGDLLVTSSTEGHAMADADPSVGTVLGKALEPMDAERGTIRILVTLQ